MSWSLKDFASWNDEMITTWSRLGYWGRRNLTCTACDTGFATEKKKQQHIDKVHGYFTHGKGEEKEDLRCPHCKTYVPGKHVINPRGCLRNHLRRTHRDYAKPYIIEERPF